MTILSGIIIAMCIYALVINFTAKEQFCFNCLVIALMLLLIGLIMAELSWHYDFNHKVWTGNG